MCNGGQVSKCACVVIVYLCNVLQGTPEAVEEVGAMLVEKLPVFMQSGDLEVQERACCILQLMKYIVKLQGTVSISVLTNGILIHSRVAKMI